MRYKVVQITIASGGSSGSSAADPELAAASGSPVLMLGWTATASGAIVHAVQKIVLNADGSITVTLSAASSGGGSVTFNVTVATAINGGGGA